MPKTRSVARILAFWMLAAPAALSAEPPAPATITVTAVNAWVRPSAGPMGAAYFTLTNQSADADRLLSVDCICAKSAELHQSTMTGDGIAEMRPLDGLDLPAHASRTLAPGGSHLMLVGLVHPLKIGDQIILTLHFAKAAPLVLPVPVVMAKAPAAASDAGMSMDRMQHP